MKKLFFYMVCAILFIVVACSPESFVDEQKVDEQETEKQVADDKSTITFVASMPEGRAQTRISLEREDLDIKLKWEEGDVLELCLQYETVIEGTKSERQVVPVIITSEDGKMANFSVNVPEGVEQFKLYGVYGGNGLMEDDPTKAKLPSAEASISGSLSALQASKVVMLTFAETIDLSDNASLSVNLQHVGSLFCIQLRNRTTSSWNNIKKVQLSGVSSIGAHNSTDVAVLDLTTGDFSGTAQKDYLTFELSSPIDLAAGGLQEFWGWFAPISGHSWPAMSLKVMDELDAELAESGAKDGRASVPAGKAFYFSAVYEGGANLKFIDTAPLIDIDGNVYTTVVIGDLEWMSENLRVTHYRDGTPIPEVSTNTAWLALTSGAYSVYPYTQTSGTVTSEEDMIAIFGLLYNGHAVMDPRGLAPDGWRVATDDDYKALERAAGMSETEIEKTGGRGAIGAKLRVTSWAAPPIGTDDFGFSAVSGGYRQGANEGGFVRFGVFDGNSLWTSTGSGDNNELFRRSIRLTPVERSLSIRRMGYNVRCVRDK